MNYCSICGKELLEGQSVCPSCEANKKAAGTQEGKALGEKPKKKKKKSSKARFDFDAAVRKADELFEGIEIGDSIFGEEEKPKKEPSREKEVKTEDELGFSIETLLNKAEKPVTKEVAKIDSVSKAEKVSEISGTESVPVSEEKNKAKTEVSVEEPKPTEKPDDTGSQKEKKPVIEQSDSSIETEKEAKAEVSEKVLRLFEPIEETEEKTQEQTKESKRKLFAKKEIEGGEAKETLAVGEKLSREKVSFGERVSELFKKAKKLFFEDEGQPIETEVKAKEDETEKALIEPNVKEESETPKQIEVKAPEAVSAEKDKDNATLFDLDVKDEKVALTAKKREREGILEKELGESESAEEEEKRYGKAVITVAAVIVALLVGLFVYAAATAAKGEPIETGGVMLEYLNGEWLSERYSYAEDDTMFFRELLTVNEDETFKMVYYIDDGVNPEGYLDGTWKISEEMSGIVAFDENDSSVHLRFSQDGQNQEYVRYLLNTTDETMTLREYYNKPKTDFYDVEFTKIK